MISENDFIKNHDSIRINVIRTVTEEIFVLSREQKTSK